jgi:hypothetical protein
MRQINDHVMSFHGANPLAAQSAQAAFAHARS